MQCGEKETNSETEINKAIDSILEEDQRELLLRKRKSEEKKACREPPEDRDRSKRRNSVSTECRTRHTAVEKSKRFSLRLMEALRAIQRKKEQSSGCTCPSSTFCEILAYVNRNFRNDGDIEAQIRTALKRTCCQGYVKNLGNDTYSLVGPFACQLTQVQKENLCKPSPDLTTGRINRTRNSSSARSPPRCNRNCRRNSRTRSQDSSIDLSLPSSVEEDLLRQRIERELDQLQGHSTINNDNNSGMNNETMNLMNNENIFGNRNNSHSRRSSPDRQCSAREENETVGTVRNPAQNLEISADLPGFEDDDVDNEPIEIPDEADQDNEEDEDDAFDDGASDDSVMRQLRRNGGRAADASRDRELKRWIRNCRRECARRAQQGDALDK